MKCVVVLKPFRSSAPPFAMLTCEVPNAEPCPSVILPCWTDSCPAKSALSPLSFTFEIPTFLRVPAPETEPVMLNFPSGRLLPMEVSPPPMLSTEPAAKERLPESTDSVLLVLASVAAAPATTLTDEEMLRPIRLTIAPSPRTMEPVPRFPLRRYTWADWTFSPPEKVWAAELKTCWEVAAAPESVSPNPDPPSLITPE